MDWDYSRHYARFHSDTPEHTANLQAMYRRWLEPHLPTDKSLPILDVGCGRGYALEWLRQRQHTRVAGVDCDPAQVAFARARGLEVERTEDTIAWLDQRPASAGLVLLMDVLEHLPRGQDRLLLEAIMRTLRPGGMLICTVPNALSPLANHWRYLDYTHHTSFTSESLDFLISHAGFRLTGIAPAELAGRPARLYWPPGRHTLRWWTLVLSRLPTRLCCIGEFGWKQGLQTPLSPNLLATALRD